MLKTLSVLLTVVITEAGWAAKAIGLPVPGAPDVILGFPSEKVLWSLLFGNAVGLVVYLWKALRDTEKEDIKEIKQDIKDLAAHIKTMPTRETVEMMIWKHLKEKE